MGWTNALRFRITSFLRPSRMEDELDQEMRSHFEQIVDDFQAEGFDEPEARRRAAREFGNFARAKEEARDSWGTRLVFDFFRDLRFAARQLGKSKGFAFVSLSTIALAIAACATVYSILDSVLFRPLPYEDPDRMVMIWEVAPFGRNSVSAGAFRDWQAASAILDTLTLMAPVTQNLRGPDGPERLFGSEVSANFLDTLALSPLRGRSFHPEEEQVNGPAGVMLTEEMWRSRFDADESLVGSTLILNEQPREVVGILPANAWLEPSVDFFIPAVLDPSQAFRYNRANHWLTVLGRLKDGVTAEQLEAELRSIKERLNSEYPPYKRDWSIDVASLRATINEGPREALWTLAAAVGLVLAIACSNVANLLLARFSRRRGELAMRAALGASAGRTFRQSLAESLLLAGAGGGIGILLALGAIQIVRADRIGLMPGAMLPSMDGRTLLACIAIICGAALLFGILPAWKAARSDPGSALKSASRAATSGSRSRAQSLLVVGEVALTVALLSASGLLLRSLAVEASEDPGYTPENAFTFDLTLPGEIYGGPEKRIAFASQVLERLEAIPGVDSAGVLSASPLHSGVRGEFVSREDRPETRQDYLASALNVDGGFFETLDARLLQGRFLNETDNNVAAAQVALIDQKLADTLYPDSDAVGQLLNVFGSVWQIVGVVSNMKLDPSPRPFGTIFMPHAYFPFTIGIVLRSDASPATLLESARNAVASVDSGIPIANARTLTQALERSREDQRFILALIATFAAAALLLACAGLYGVMSYTTATRHREICIRRALGASRGDAIGLVLRDGGKLTLFGLALGLAAALGLGQLLASQLYQVSPYDPTVLLGTVALFALVGLLACWAPARRAAIADPNSGLRNE